MPRIGQLLSALLIATLGVLVVQLLLLAGMHQRLALDSPTPPASDTLLLLTPALDVPFAAASDPSGAVPAFGRSRIGVLL